VQAPAIERVEGGGISFEFFQQKTLGQRIEKETESRRKLRTPTTDRMEKR